MVLVKLEICLVNMQPVQPHLFFFLGANFAKAIQLDPAWPRACQMDRGELENLSCPALLPFFGPPQ